MHQEWNERWLAGLSQDSWAAIELGIFLARDNKSENGKCWGPDYFFWGQDELPFIPSWALEIASL
jgi:hypothetical protein